MKRGVVALILLACGGVLGVLPIRAGYKLSYCIYRISVPEVGTLGLIGGRPCLLTKEHAGDWDLDVPREDRWGGRREDPEPGLGWALRGDGRIATRREDAYLAYDLDGVEKGVVLANRPGWGSKWDFHFGKDAEGNTVHTLRAAEGRLNGWYLDYTTEDGPAPGEVRHWLILSPQPGHIKQVTTTDLGHPIGHK
jgi:hypothetical protein